MPHSNASVKSIHVRWVEKSSVCCQSGKGLMTTFTYCVGLSLCHDAGSAELDGAKQLRPLPSQEGEQAKHEAAKCLPC